MKDIKFTIIIPSYNVEDYICRCVDSVLNQTYQNFEVILVNDGSTDKTGILCDKYAKKDNRIRVIHKNNGGLSDARNAALRVVTGDYVIFLDSDDYIDIDSLKVFNNKLKIKREDVLITKLVQAYDDNVNKEMDLNMEEILEENPSKYSAVKWVFNSSENTWPAPKYIISNLLIKENKLRFKEGFLHEDIDWTLNIFYYAETFGVSYKTWYFHRMGRIGSITSTGNYKRALDVITIAKEHIDNEESIEIDSEIKNIMIERLIKSVYSILSQYKLASSIGRKEIVNILSKNRYILKNATCLKHKIFYFSTKVLGIKLSLDIMSILS